MYNLPLPPPPYPLPPPPPPPFSPSLTSLVVSVDVTHHVYLLFLVTETTAVEYTSCYAMAESIPTALTELFWRWSTASSAFPSLSSRTSLSLFLTPPPPPSSPHFPVPDKPSLFCGRKATCLLFSIVIV